MISKNDLNDVMCHPLMNQLFPDTAQVVPVHYAEVKYSVLARGMTRKVLKYSATVLPMIIACFGLVLGQEQNLKKLEKTAMSNLNAEFGDRVAIKRSRATNKVNFVRVDSGSPGGLVIQGAGMAANEKVRSFLKKYGPIFGLQNPETELTQRIEKDDDLGGSHITYDQYYNGVPVFGGVLIAHFDKAGALRSVNGSVAPFVKLDTKPEISRESASATAALAVGTEFLNSRGLKITDADLRIYRTGMAQGVSGENHLVWEVTVTNDRDIRKFVFVDAHSGEIVDQISGIYDALDRRTYDSLGIFAIPASYPSSPFWREGFPFPTGDSRADEIVAASGETYDLYRKAFGRDSFDGQGGPMISFFDLGNDFSNAFQTFLGGRAVTFFGDDLTSDDVVAHEWTHAYTAYTDNLIYAWQPGALNESYSDIFGETVDQLNGRGLDSPGGSRETNGDACSIFSQPTDLVTITTPGTIAGVHDAAFNRFAEGSPEIPSSGIAGQVVQVDDGVGIGSDGCTTPFANAGEVAGKIAMIDATAESPDGICFATTKVLNAQANGATAVILANDSSLGNQPVNFGCHCVLASIPSVTVGEDTGDLIRNQLGTGVNVSITSNAARNHENTYKWLLGEDTSFSGIRDMWNPTCYFNPGKVSESRYNCSGFDFGGVHENSGIPNHTFALLVDGGNYNGQTVSGIGLTKAAHIYFRAMTVYQTPFTDFADNAESLEASAQDLLGRNLPDLRTGLPSGQRISPNDLKQLHAATLATELRKPPTQCNFRPLLGKNPPDDSCGLPATAQTTIFADTFETNPLVRWKATREVVDPTLFQGGNWSWVHNLPDGRQGKGLFANDPAVGCDLPDPSQVGVLELASPAINIPPGLSSAPHLSFDHWVALEEGFDGAQLMISVNGGPYQLVDPSAFIYNGYNESLLTFSENPRIGQPAFTGTDAGSFNGSWGTSIVDLSGYVHSGDTIRLRFDMSTDYCFGTGTGWYLDNVRVYACNYRNH